jgi:hypothetical protein
MRFRNTIILIATCTILVPAAVKAESEWKLSKEADGIAVYTRPMKDSQFNEFMSVGLIDEPIEVCARIMYDVPAKTRWLDDCTMAYIVEKKSEDVAIIYSEMKAPWPVSYRDITMITTVTKGRDIVKQTFMAVPHPLEPERKGRVRIYKMYGELIFERKGPKTLTTYRIMSEAGGSLPPSFVNFFSTKHPFKTLQKLRIILRDDKYQH